MRLEPIGAIGLVTIAQYNHVIEVGIISFQCRRWRSSAKLCTTGWQSVQPTARS